MVKSRENEELGTIASLRIGSKGCLCRSDRRTVETCFPPKAEQLGGKVIIFLIRLSVPGNSAPDGNTQLSPAIKFIHIHRHTMARKVPQ